MKISPNPSFSKRGIIVPLCQRGVGGDFKESAKDVEI